MISWNLKWFLITFCSKVALRQKGRAYTFSYATLLHFCSTSKNLPHLVATSKTMRARPFILASLLLFLLAPLASSRCPDTSHCQCSWATAAVCVGGEDGSECFTTCCHCDDAAAGGAKSFVRRHTRLNQMRRSSNLATSAASAASASTAQTVDAIQTPRSSAASSSMPAPPPPTRAGSTTDDAATTAALSGRLEAALSAAASIQEALRRSVEEQASQKAALDLLKSKVGTMDLAAFSSKLSLEASVAKLEWQGRMLQQQERQLQGQRQASAVGSAGSGIARASDSIDGDHVRLEEFGTYVVRPEEGVDTKLLPAVGFADIYGNRDEISLWNKVGGVGGCGCCGWCCG